MEPVYAENDVFLENLGDVEISDVTGDVVVGITIEANVLGGFTERHTAVDGKIVLTDLKSVARNYFHSKYDALVNSLALNRQLSYVDKVRIYWLCYNTDGERISDKKIGVDLRYANVVMPNKYAIEGSDSYVTHILGREKVKKLRDQDFDVICTYLSGSVKLNVAYIANEEAISKNSQITKSIDVTVVTNSWNASQEHAMFIMKYDWNWVFSQIQSNVESGVTKDDIINMTVQIMDETGTVKDFRLVQRDKYPYKMSQRFAFIGCMGQLEFVSLTGFDDLTPELSSTFVESAEEYRKVHSDFVMIHKSKTGYLSRIQKATMRDMAVAPKVWKVEGTKFIPVTITDIDYSDRTPNNEPVGFVVNWRFSKNNLQNIYEVE